MSATEFIRSIINNRPWEPKQSTLNKLVQGYVQVNSYEANSIETSRKEIIDAIKELQYKGEIKILAGLGWATGDVEFIFQANE
ncbi:hypothetical protein [Desulfoscipio gibsoniae]|uniref:hypothetical protein n=1 Tax=Desulfoscipio gibsoniae TaxID=102134 RepID=UPI000232C5D9|nr:hypothetical protein [Desulfoscipio gibsoniae]